jgi:hypothetical protein
MVKTQVDKVEHNLQLPEGPTAFIEFTVCRDDSVVERAKFKEDKYRLGEGAQATPRGRDEGRDSEADGSFAGEVEGVGFPHAEGTSHRISQSRMEDSQPLFSPTSLLGRSCTVRLTSNVRHLARVHATQRSIDYGRRARNPLLGRKARNWTSLNNLSLYKI